MPTGRQALSSLNAIFSLTREVLLRPLPISEKSFDALIDETFARPREMAWLIGTFAGLALTLSALGVYGVMAYVTTARALEIGIRVAIGVVLAAMALRMTTGLLFGVGPFDPATLLSVAALLTGVSIAASAIPAVAPRGLRPRHFAERSARPYLKYAR